LDRSRLSWSIWPGALVSSMANFWGRYFLLVQILSPSTNLQSTGCDSGGNSVTSSTYQKKPELPFKMNSEISPVFSSLW
jgi:hypothetical protein